LVDNQAPEAPHAGAEPALKVAITALEDGPVQIDPEVLEPTAAPGPSAEMRAGARFDREQSVEGAPLPIEQPLTEPARPLVSPRKPLMEIDPEWTPGSDRAVRVEETGSASASGHGASGFERQLYEDPELGEPFVGIGRAVPIGGVVPETGGLVVSLDGPAATEPVAARRPATSHVNELWETTKTAIRVAVRNGQSEARITLRPAELGEVRITLRYENGGVSAALTADSAQAFEALAQAATELRRGLEQQGVSVLGLEVRMSGDEAQREASLWQDGTGSAESAYDEPLGEDESPDEASDQDDPGSEPGGIDVFA
jgi:flagellar hook-length control protein FliK